MPKNLQNIRQSHKLPYDRYGELETGISSGRTNLRFLTDLVVTLQRYKVTNTKHCLLAHMVQKFIV